MTENERDAGDAMAKILKDVIAEDKIDEFLRYTGWSTEAWQAIKAWEDAKKEDA